MLKQTRDSDFWLSSRVFDDNQWIVAFSLSDAPMTYYLYDRRSKTATLLFTERPELEAYTLAKMEPITFPARNE